MAATSTCRNRCEDLYLLIKASAADTTASKRKSKFGPMPPEIKTEKPPVCDYEGSDYQQRFWDQADRRYEDQVEAIAIRSLLPKSGKLLLEGGAGAGRNT